MTETTPETTGPAVTDVPDTAVPETAVPETTEEAAPGVTHDPAPEPDPAPGPAPEAAAPAEGPARPPRRRLRAAARWTAAVLVFAAFGGAATYAVAQPERTKIPGLKTPGDGRWTYPPVALPKLPAGRPRPLDAAANPAGVHYADLRSLLLPLPEQAVADRSFPGTKGWLPSADYLKRYDFEFPDTARDTRLELQDDALRHIAARAWTMPDGTRTEIYLVQFLTAGHRNSHYAQLAGVPVRGARDAVDDGTVQSKSIPSAETVYAQAKAGAHGGVSTRTAILGAGDTYALVVQTRKGALPEVPFRQTVRLQAQLLG